MKRRFIRLLAALLPLGLAAAEPRPYINDKKAPEDRKDLEAIQKRALAEGLPYQTLISSVLHKYASGRLKEV